MKRVQLRRIFRVVNGGTPTSGAENWDGDVAWATPVDLARVNGGRLTVTDRALTATGLATGSRLIPAGSLILSTRAPIGYVVECAVPTAFNQGCRGLVAREEVDIRYFRYQLSALEAELGALGQGSTFVELSGDSLASAELVAPLLAHQRAIADYLDTETARIDALIAKKQRMIGLLQERWRAAASHRMRQLAHEVGTIQLKHVVRCLDGRRVPLSTEERSGRAGQYPYYGASGVVDYVDDYLFDETLVLLGEDGAQLGVAHYPIAQMVEGRVWVNNHAHVLRPSASDPAFLVLHLNTFDRVPFISGGTREKITQDDMNRIPVPNLSIARQREEASQLTAMRTRCDSACRVLERQIDLLREHRQALITAAVTGEFEVPGVAA